MQFKINYQDKKTQARVGLMQLEHGVVQTPNFVPVGTQATVKALSPRDLKEIGVEIFFANTYHLYLRPGARVVNKMGGLSRFTGWNGAIMTDSGGFQVFSLGLGRTVIKKQKGQTEIFLPRAQKGVTGEKLAQISEDGVYFKSHLDGSKHFLSPEISMQIQSLLGADILMAFDDCTFYPCSYEYAENSMERTHRWLKRSLAEHQKLIKKQNHYQNLFGVVQGSTYKELRIKSAQFVNEQNTPGIAIGGVSVGESKKEMCAVLDWVIPYLASEKPRHLLGVGEIVDIFTAVEKGIDTLDCVIPTRWARNGTLLISPEISREEKSKTLYRLIISNAKYIKDNNPIDRSCRCWVCQNFSRAYLNHLYKTDEILGINLGTYHNIYFMVSLLKEIREAIVKGKFLELKSRWV